MDFVCRMNYLLGKNLKIIVAFILVNIFSFFALVLIPAESSKPNILFLFCLNNSFILLLIVFSVLTYIIYPKKNQKINRVPIKSNLLKKNINFLSYAPIIGILLILFDRVVLRGIDYMQGLRLARYTWLETSGGNLVGIIGNLLVPFSYISIYFLIIYFNRINRKEVILLTLSAVFGIVGHAALNGGRSNLLLGLIMILIAFLFRENTKKVFRKNFNSIKTKIIFIVLGSLSFLYMSHIIQSSAALGALEVSELLPLGIESLYGVPDYNYLNSDHLPIVYTIIYMLSYLYHGQWTAQVAYATTLREGSYATPPILYKLGIVDKSIMDNNLFSDTGAFISFPGALYYDFNFFGFFLFSSMLGILLGLVFVIITRSKVVGGFKMAFIIGILYIIFLSPILPAYGLAYFNFILYAFIALSLINKFVFRKKINFIG